MTVLDAIFAHKRQEVAACRAAEPLPAVQARARQAPAPLDFAAALRRSPRQPALIAEVKAASPSRGLLVEDFDPYALAGAYAANGAAAISVLTDARFFRGSLAHLAGIAARAPRVPILRKDFVCDPYQVYEARAAGADAVLLIAAALPAAGLRELHTLAEALGMAALVEVHDEAELARALECGPHLVGINNRDLRDFTVRLDTALRLRPLVPPGVCVVAESGIHTAADVTRLAESGIDAMLVGEALVTAADVPAAVRALVDAGRARAAAERVRVEA